MELNMLEEQNVTDDFLSASEIRLAVFLLGLLIIWSCVSGLWTKPAGEGFAPEIRATSSVEIVRGDSSKNQIILTFDGGDGNQSAEKILSTLANRGLTSTFFLTGRFIENNRDLVRRMVDSGQEVFSHTYFHPHLPELSDGEIARELIRTEDVFTRLTGRSIKPYFRAPYGERNSRVLSVAFREGYQSVFWTVDALDWEESLGQTEAMVEDRIIYSLAPGNIYLLHLGDNISGAILPSLIGKIEKRGYKVVSLLQGI